MPTCFYVAFLVDQDIRIGRRLVVEAGIDLLAGPYLTRPLAEQAMASACRAHPRLAAYAGLAAFLLTTDETPTVRIDIIPVSDAQVQAYNARHQTALPWPLPVLSPQETARPDREPRKRSSKKAATAARPAATASHAQGDTSYAHA